MPEAYQLELLTPRADARVLAPLGVIERLSLASVVVVTGVVLCGWIFPAVGNVLPHSWALMKANSAACLLLIALSLALSRNGEQHQAVLGGVIAAPAVFIAALVLFEHIGGRTTGIDTVLAADASSDIPGRMAIQTSLYVLFFGLAQIVSALRRPTAHIFIEVLTFLLVSLTIVIAAGYLFGAAQLYGQSSTIRTSPQSLICMALLTFIAVKRCSMSGHFSILVGSGIGSRFVRIAVPIAFIVPVLIVGGSIYATRAGVLTLPYSAALTVAGFSVALFEAVVIMAWRIARLEAGLREMSLTDELTGTFNRRGFDLLGEQALRDARRAKTALTILFLDLDGLKRVNDTLGHDEGSNFVKDVADLLRGNFRTADIVGRIGGDEFAVVARCEGASADIVINRMGEAVDELNCGGTKPYTIAYSVGKVDADQFPNDSFDMLVARADALMYEQKRAHRIAQNAQI